MKRKRIRAFTIVEIAVGMSVTLMVVFFATVTLVSTLNVWGRGQTRISAETEVSSTLREVRDQLKESMSIVVDVDGKGVTYRLPVKDEEGQYGYPLMWDGELRRFQLNSNGDFVKVTGTASKVLLRDVVTTDRRGGSDSGSYLPFVAGTGTIVRTLTVQLVIKRSVKTGSENAYGRVREIVLLRNTPTLSQ